MKISNKSCTGCGLCSLVCPVNCIAMKEDSKGEVIPIVDKDKCINCKKCKTECPQNNMPETVIPGKCYVAWSKNKEDLELSASGGVATVVARKQLKQKEMFYGCDYDDDISLKHFCVNNQDDIERVRSSKYSQSNAYECFLDIKKNLDDRKRVVFIGTPCQVSALKRFVHNNINLITIDLVCHGTPPTRYLKEHIEHLKITNPECIRFRGQYDQKLTLWKNCIVQYKKDWQEDSYFKAFYDNSISRDSCYSCQYACAGRVGDITLADFWGLGKLKKLNAYNTRPSLVLLNSQRGIDYFELVKEDLYYEERDVSEGIAGNGRLNKPPGKGDNAYIFQYLYSYLGFEKTLKVVDTYMAIKKRAMLINKLIKKVIKRVKKIVRNRIIWLKGKLK